eukprot:TRINITY_DN2699_c0_g1_i1.p1 TRINITY_DN2699_c0_g1~~TRINITY_DN2699_c0_g1_i1.p1  ORF type:complete len:687 (-),score=99.43 TRINITY_DN2699_c0_g1_i1:638-2698(-)
MSLDNQAKNAAIDDNLLAPDAQPTSTITGASTDALREESDRTIIYIIIILISFHHGINGLAELALLYLFKDDFKMQPHEAGFVLGLALIPWFIKPAWGILSDGLPLFGYRRKSYLILVSFIEFLAWNGLALYATNMLEGIIYIIIIQAALSFSVVIGEALLVEITRDKKSNETASEEQKQHEASKNVSIFFGAKWIGIFLTAYTGGLLLLYVDKRTVLHITSTFPMFVLVWGIFLPERKVIKRQTDSEKKELNAPNPGDIMTEEETRKSYQREISNYEKAYNFLRQPEVWKPVLFILCFASTPTAHAVLFFFFTNELGFTSEFMGWLKMAQALATLLGITIYHYCLAQVRFRKILFWSTILCALIGSSMLILVTRKNVEWGIPDKLFCLGDSLLIQLFGEINFFPILVYACRVCPKDIEGTVYALLISALNLGFVISLQLGAIITWYLGISDSDFSRLWILIVIQSVAMVIPLFFLPFVRFSSATKAAENSQNMLEDEKDLLEDNDKQALEQNQKEKESEEHGDQKKNDYGSMASSNQGVSSAQKESQSECFDSPFMRSRAKSLKQQKEHGSWVYDFRFYTSSCNKYTNLIFCLSDLRNKELAAHSLDSIFANIGLHYGQHTSLVLCLHIIINKCMNSQTIKRLKSKSKSFSKILLQVQGRDGGQTPFGCCSRREFFRLQVAFRQR